MNYFTFTCLSSIVFCFGFNQQKIHYLAQTSSLEYFIVETNGVKDTIHSSRTDNTIFDFYAHPKKSAIMVENGRCDSAFVSLLNIKADIATKDIPLASGDAILIKDCFDKYEITLLDKINSIWNWIYESPLKRAKTYCESRTPSFQGGDKPKPEDPKMVFENKDNSYYSDWNGFNLDFQIYENYPIKEITIISHEYVDKKLQLLFCAGAATKTANNFKWTKEIPAITTILEEQTSKETGQKRYRIVGKKLEQQLFSPIKKGARYQLAIYLENDNSGHYYLHNFYLATNEEKAFIQSLAKK